MNFSVHSRGGSLDSKIFRSLAKGRDGDGRLRRLADATSTAERDMALSL